MPKSALRTGRHGRVREVFRLERHPRVRPCRRVRAPRERIVKCPCRTIVSSHHRQQTKDQPVRVKVLYQRIVHGILAQRRLERTRLPAESKPAEQLVGTAGDGSVQRLRVDRAIRAIKAARRVQQLKVLDDCDQSSVMARPYGAARGAPAVTTSSCPTSLWSLSLACRRRSTAPKINPSASLPTDATSASKRDSATPLTRAGQRSLSALSMTMI